MKRPSNISITAHAQRTQAMTRILLITFSLFCALYPAQAQRVVRGEPIAPAPEIKAAAPTPIAVTAAAETNAVSATTKAVKMNGKEIVVGFDKLGGFTFPLTSELEYNTNTPAAADVIVNAMSPANIRKLDNQLVTIDGFMLPLTYEKDMLTEFLLMRDQMECCFGGTPEMHQFIKVHVKSPVPPIDFSAVRVRGVLRVSADRQSGVLSDIYRMEADKVRPVPEH
ncbi:MAG: hypothetical protein JWM68_1667 [Verrucomicrobiales bacterium]|nr:hypothetical protein [Verrucomicrobiales bacterium]